MRRVLLAPGGLACAVLAAALVLGVATTSAAQSTPPVADQPGVLVTDAELCAFRAPLALTGSDDVPVMCAATVAWLKRLAELDPGCATLWVELGAVPDCALPYR